MRITKKELLAAMSSNEGFEIIKDDYGRGDKINSESETPVLVKWKGLAFFISFNENSQPDKDKLDDDDFAYNSVAADFAVTVIVVGSHPFDDNINEDDIIDANIKYKIANYVNMRSHLNSVVIYREDGDLFEISSRHGVFLREGAAHHINGTIMTMALTCTVTSQKTREAIESYRNSPEAFLKKCKGIR
ncbi:hypothetical protein N1S82_000831, partial [Serratia marcescens]